MPIRDFLHKKDKIADAQNYDDDALETLSIPTFVRSDTNTFEVIKPPSINSPIDASDGANERRPSRLSIFKPRSRSASSASHTSLISPTSGRSSLEQPSSNPKRLSERLHLRRERSSSRVPQDLPDIATITIEDASGKGDSKAGAERKANAEAQWEERATKLVQFNEMSPGPSSPIDLHSSGRAPPKVSSPVGDDNIQEAIRLHEMGDLKRSTSMFGRLADLKGESNALSQVLYGLALRFVILNFFTSFQFCVQFYVNRFSKLMDWRVEKSKKIGSAYENLSFLHFLWLSMKSLRILGFGRGCFGMAAVTVQKPSQPDEWLIMFHGGKSMSHDTGGQPAEQESSVSY